jgi:hypothetical protein
MGQAVVEARGGDVWGAWGGESEDRGGGGSERKRTLRRVDMYSFDVILLELTTGKVTNDISADLCRMGVEAVPEGSDVHTRHHVSDVYNFGVILIELTTDKLANDSVTDLLVEWAWKL